MAIIKATASKASGKKSTIFIETKPNIIGYGMEGTVHSRQAYLTHKGRWKKLSVTEKVFNRTPHMEWTLQFQETAVGKEYVRTLTPENQVKTMDRLRKAGCQTIPTFRVVEHRDKKTLLMTDLRKTGCKVTNCFFNKKPESVASIENWQDIKKQITANFDKAIRTGIMLYPDAWTLLVWEHEGKRYGYPIITDLGFSGWIPGITKVPDSVAKIFWNTYMEEIGKIESHLKNKNKV